MFGILRLDRREVEKRIVVGIDWNAVVVEAERLERRRIGRIGVDVIGNVVGDGQLPGDVVVLAFGFVRQRL